MTRYKLTVGLEIHVQLKTQTKMFCGCKNDPFNSQPNANVCPVCYGLPGALPLLNQEAVKKTIELGQALGGNITNPTFWARKNYFYPDLPKGYQISQSSSPLVVNAKLTIEGKTHQIARIHLEEDAGKMVHQAGSHQTLANYNRAGVPLMEMVTAPDFDTSSDAKRFCQELQRVMRSLEISDADMEKGQMRCEANISVSKTKTLGVKVEVKNINSFRSVEKAIEHEYDRQIAVLEAGRVVVHETRTWNDPTGKTVAMRSKETSADYRYFPEPDLPVIEVPIGSQKVHKLPDERRVELEAVGLKADTARVLVDKALDERVLIINGRQPGLASEAANQMIEFPSFTALSVEDQIKVLNARTAGGWTKDALATILEKTNQGTALDEVLAEYTTVIDLDPVISETLKSHDSAVNDYRAGKQQVLHFLVGQVMSQTRGKANINEVRARLEKALKAS